MKKHIIGSCRSYFIITGLLSIFLAGCVQLPKQSNIENIIWLEQGWTSEERNKFHYESQGTMTLSVPYEWFAALEQPGFSLLSTKGLIIENGFLSRLGFISGEITPNNEAGLPVGFSIIYNAENPSISNSSFNAIGLTCAACHTGQMNVNGQSIRYDGGPAMTNLTELTSILGLALIETYLVKDRFKRFSQRVLGVTNTIKNRKKLKKALKKTIRNQIRSIISPLELKEAGMITNLKTEFNHESFKDFAKSVKKLIYKKREKSTNEGYTRLDALNRIGNTVFASDTGNYANTAIIQAPVNYPHIWNTSWFRWVQYDASIMGPMIRNSGEAMGVLAYVKLDKKSPDNFKSSVKLKNLHWMETLLAGTTPPTKNKEFTGLSHPKWDETIFSKIDVKKHKKGAQLYKKHCQGCHLPPFDSNAFWANNWTPVDSHGMSFLDLPIVDLKFLGTDPEEAKILMERTVDTTGIGLNTNLFLDSYDWFKETPIYYGAASDECKKITIKDGKAVPFSLALGATVQEVNNYWYRTHNTSAAQKKEMNGFRKNCLRAPPAYKARPLNGIWATAPFLHNGSVPNIFSLLSPVSERPNKFYLGSLDYDIKKMGYDTKQEEGLFELDTSIKGNSNRGHEFSNSDNVGVIGPMLTVNERYEIIEYLKDIKELK